MKLAQMFTLSNTYFSIAYANFRTPNKLWFSLIFFFGKKLNTKYFSLLFIGKLDQRDQIFFLVISPQ